jgi:transposase
VEKERKRRTFSAEYKAETVQLIQRSGNSIWRMALELGIGESVLRRWAAQAEIEAGRGPAGAPKRSEREELVELRRKNQRLRMEREILKKLSDAVRAASPAGRETASAVSLRSALRAMVVRFLVTSRTRQKNMVWGWIAHLIVVTPAGRSRLYSAGRRPDADPRYDLRRSWDLGVGRATEQKPGFKDGWCFFSHGSNDKSVALCAFSVPLVR